MSIQEIDAKHEEAGELILHPRFLRRKQAGEYLTKRYGFGSPRTLAKGVVTGDTPEYHKAGSIVLYTPEALDRWALAKIGAVRRSSSDAA